MTNKGQDTAHLQALFQTALAGDGDSYRQFLHNLAPVLRKMVAVRINVHDIEDVVQEILISVHKARHTHDGVRPLMPWVRAIARFRIADHLRKHYAHGGHAMLDVHDFADVLTDVTILAPGNEVLEDVLHGVPEREQKILTLMHVQGFTAKEVAGQLGLTESAVKVAAHRAIQKIRKRFNP